MSMKKIAGARQQKSGAKQTGSSGLFSRGSPAVIISYIPKVGSC